MTHGPRNLEPRVWVPQKRGNGISLRVEQDLNLEAVSPKWPYKKYLGLVVGKSDILVGASIAHLRTLNLWVWGPLKRRAATPVRETWQLPNSANQVE